jgi:hypothetical protein
MKLVLIYGRPAVGKLTVARILAEKVHAPLFHNHLTVNLVLSIYGFGTPGFVELRERIWMDVFRRAMADRVPLLIFTFNPENSVPQRFIDGLFAEVAAGGGAVLPVELTASEDTIEARLGAESRRREGKTLDAHSYRVLRMRGAFDSPVIRSPAASIATDALSPEQVAGRIAALL